MRTVQKIHLWASVVLALPILWLIVTGIPLHLRQEAGFSWVQPPTAAGAERDRPAITPEGMLEAARAVPEMHVTAWSDIARLDLRPRDGVVKILSARSAHEIQVDAASGAVIASAGRWSDRIEAWHDWSAFGLRLLVGVPGALAYTLVGLTGLILLWPILKREARRLADRVRGRPRRPVPRRPGFTAWSWRNHWWISLIVLVPWTVVAITGVVLQLRDELPIQAPRAIGAAPGAMPAVGWTGVLDAARSADAGIESWRQVRRVYFQADRGVYELHTRGAVLTELQIDGTTGALISIAALPKAVWEEVHGGELGGIGLDSRFLFWTFAVVHVVSVLLWATGLVIGLHRLGWGRNRAIAADNRPASA